MYEAFYNLSAEPFRLSPDHRFCYVHDGFARARAYMAYAFIRAEGFILITGRPGTGKTTLINELLESLADEDVNTANLVCTQLQADDLLRMVAYSFGVDRTIVGKGDLLRHLETLFRGWRSEGQRALLVVDEAQDLSEPAIEELRLLSNIQENGKPLLQIFLLGQPELRDLMHSPAMEQVHQRIIAASHLEALPEEETEAYILHRLKKVGWVGDPRISKAVFPLIFKFSEGVPRRINLICSRLLLRGFVEQRHDIGVADLREVILDLQGENLAAGGGFSEDDFYVEDEFEGGAQLTELETNGTGAAADIDEPVPTRAEAQNTADAVSRTVPPIGEPTPAKEQIPEPKTVQISSADQLAKHKHTGNESRTVSKERERPTDQMPGKAQTPGKVEHPGTEPVRVDIRSQSPATRQKRRSTAPNVVVGRLLLGSSLLLILYWLVFVAGFGPINEWRAQAGHWWTARVAQPQRELQVTPGPDEYPAVPEPGTQPVTPIESSEQPPGIALATEPAREPEPEPAAVSVQAASAAALTSTSAVLAGPEPPPVRTYGSRVEFDSASAELSIEAMAMLDGIAAQFVESRVSRRLAVSYSQGSAGQGGQKPLARRRADTVAYHLIKKGVEAGQLTLRELAVDTGAAGNTQDLDTNTETGPGFVLVSFRGFVR